MSILLPVRYFYQSLNNHHVNRYLEKNLFLQLLGCMPFTKKQIVGVILYVFSYIRSPYVGWKLGEYTFVWRKEKNML